MDINTHIKQGILHYLQVVGKYPHIQSLFPESQIGEKDLLDIVQKEAYYRLSKESRFFFTIISVFSCGNYPPIQNGTLPDTNEAVVSAKKTDPLKSTVPAIDHSVEDMLSAAMPKK